MNQHAETYFTAGCGRCAKGGTPECKVNTWAAELAALRALVLDSGLIEECKWGVPCYTFEKGNVVLIHSFKEYCALLFIKGALLKDAKSILIQQTENVQGGRQLRFTDVREVVKLKSTIKAYLQEAIAVEKAGLKVSMKPTAEFAVPEEFQAKLDASSALKTAFEALTTGRQRAYLLHFAAAKQAKTREARIEKCTPQILNGKGLLDLMTTFPTQTPVFIAGGGPVGLTLAALLASFGIRSVVVENDPSYCTGSRAICMSRRSQEILGWVGADKPLVKKGLSWVGGRSYYRDTEVLHFQMPNDPTQRFAPMVNIQQYFAEQYAHEAAQKYGDLVDVRWNCTVKTVREVKNGNAVDVVDVDGKTQTIHADWLVACDGGRSTVREQLGLQLQGMQYDGKYVIVDIRQKTQRDVERLAWFDPPSNPGSTILMHRQPEDVWRIDYQIRDDEDPVEAIKPENVLPRVQSHLSMIGEIEPWEPLWISIYNAKCLSLETYRPTSNRRVLFAGDAAHLVPIFGVRGLNSGLDDAGNLAWKLARVIQGTSPDSLLDTYSTERVHAAQENMAFGAKSTEFMAPPNFAFKLMRTATLKLALADEKVRSLINPRQSTPIHYVASALNVPDTDTWSNDLAAPGMPMPEVLLEDGTHLSQQFGKSFVCIVLGAALEPSKQVNLQQNGIKIYSYSGNKYDGYSQFGLSNSNESALMLVRPDGYVMGRWKGVDIEPLLTGMKQTGVNL